MSMVGYEQAKHIFPASICFNFRDSPEALISVHSEQGSTSINSPLFPLGPPILLASPTAFRETLYRFAVENWHLLLIKYFAPRPSLDVPSLLQWELQ